MSAAAGMSASGRTTVVCGYGVFLTMRALEMVRSFVCYPNLNVKIMSSHGGHHRGHRRRHPPGHGGHRFHDDPAEHEGALPGGSRLRQGLRGPGPGDARSRLRPPHARSPLRALSPRAKPSASGDRSELQEGHGLTLATYGDTVFQALQAAEALARNGIQAEVLDLYSLKPFDREPCWPRSRRPEPSSWWRTTSAGMAWATSWAISCSGHAWLCLSSNLGLDDTFAESGAYQQMLAAYGLSGGTHRPGCRTPRG